MQGGVHSSYRVGREPSAPADLALLEELGIEGVDHDRSQLLQLHPAQGGEDVLPHVGGVGGVGGGANGALGDR